MIGKPITGKSFGGCVRYLVNRPEATILEAEGVRNQNARSITMDFNMQRKMRPGLGKAVGHTILSWSAEDRGKLSDERMVKVARTYMEKMGIRDTQYLIVKHTDRLHPHLHIVYNRVNNNGQTISDRNDYKRNVKACRELTETYGFYFAAGKKQVKRQRLKGADKVKYAIHDTIKEALRSARNWNDLAVALQRKGIEIHYKYRGDSGDVQGVSFGKDGMIFKGSAIDRSLSFARIEKELQQNNRLAQRTVMLHQEGQKQLSGRKQRPYIASFPGDEMQMSNSRNLLDILFESRPDELYYDPVEQAYKRRKKKEKRYKRKF